MVRIVIDEELVFSIEDTKVFEVIDTIQRLGGELEPEEDDSN